MTENSDASDSSDIAIGLFFMLYFFIAFVEVIGGIDDADDLLTKCHSTWAKVEYVMPFYRVGCWLGEPVGGCKTKHMEWEQGK